MGNEAVSQQHTPAHSPVRQSPQPTAHGRTSGVDALPLLLGLGAVAPRGAFNSTLTASLQGTFGNQFVQRLVRGRPVTTNAQTAAPLNSRVPLRRAVGTVQRDIHVPAELGLAQPDPAPARRPDVDDIFGELSEQGAALRTLSDNMGFLLDKQLADFRNAALAFGGFALGREMDKVVKNFAAIPPKLGGHGDAILSNAERWYERVRGNGVPVARAVTGPVVQRFVGPVIGAAVRAVFNPVMDEVSEFVESGITPHLAGAVPVGAPNEVFGVHGQDLLALADETENLVQHLATLSMPRATRVGHRRGAAMVQRDEPREAEATLGTRVDFLVNELSGISEEMRRRGHAIMNTAKHLKDVQPGDRQ